MMKMFIEENISSTERKIESGVYLPFDYAVGKGLSTVTRGAVKIRANHWDFMTKWWLPTGTSRCRTSEFGRRPAQCPTLLRLDSIGEVTSDSNINESVHKQQKTKMGMSTLINKGNFLGRQSLCANKQHSNRGGHFNDLSYACSEGNDSSFQVPKMEMPLFGVLAGLKMQEQTFNKECHMNIPNKPFPFNAQCFQFHPSIKSTIAHNPSVSYNTSAMENSQKKLKSNTFGCFKNFPVSKKRNRYNRYNWQLPPKADKSRVTNTPSDTTSNEKIQQSSVPKQKHTVRVCVKLQQGKSGSLGNKVKLQQAKSEPLESEKGLDAHITTQMGHLSLGEKVALENAKNTALKTSPESESEIDWFSMSRQNSEKELPSLSLMNCGDEDSDDNMCNISDEVRDLFSCCDSQSKPCDVVENRNDTDKKESDMKTSQSEQQVQLPGDISVKNMDRVTESAGSSHKNETIDSVESERSKMSIPMVLYVRDNKKARSSKKKRRKREKKSNVEQHAKNNTNFVGSDIDNKKRKFDIFSETYHSSSAGSSPMNVHSFLIAFNDEGANSSDGEIDWSDDDDGDDDECDADFLSVSSFTCPLSLNVICAVSRPESPKSSNTELEAVNSAWKINIQLNASPKKQCKSDKKVHFPSDDNLTQVHTAGDWCRKGQWEEFARDRMRFAQRIQDLESIISPVLQADHRQKIRNLLSK